MRVTQAARRRIPAEQRRALVRAAAVRTFADDGYQGASITVIARRAGVVASVIYDHFGSKRELYLDVLRDAGRDLIEATTRPTGTGSAADLFALNVDAFYRFVEQHPFTWRMIFRDPPPDDEIAAVHRDIHDQAHASITALVASFRPGEPLIEGQPRELTDTAIAAGIKAVNDGLAAWWYENRDVPREHVLAVATTLMWAGLRNLTAAGGNSADISLDHSQRVARRPSRR